MRAKESAFRGALGGLAVALSIAAYAWYFNRTGRDEPRLLSQFVTLLGFGPLGILGLILTPLKIPPLQLPQFLLWTYLFFYWITLGAVLGSLTGQPRFVPRAIAFLLVAGLVFWHWEIKHTIETGAQAALGQTVIYFARELSPIFEALEEHPQTGQPASP